MKQNPEISIGIIGFGKFSELMVQIFKKQLPNVKIKISSRSQTQDNKVFFSFEEVCQCDYVIPAVPINAFEDTIKTMLPFLSKEAAIIDICSVKLHPKNVMLNLLPETNQIICTHPNFGPESYRLNNYSTNKLNFIVEFVRATQETENKIMRFLESLGLNLIMIDAEAHDKEIGVPHFVSMFTGLVLSRLGIGRTPYGAASTQRMFEMADGVGKDFGILKDMYKYNPLCEPVLEEMKNKFGIAVSELM